MPAFGGRLRSTTMLYGVVGATFFSMSAYAGEPTPYAVKPITDYAPGVDGFNGKYEALGGTLANRTLVGNQGALSFPLGGPLGVQIDAAFGSLAHQQFGHAAGHLFWRNPGQGLFGIYASHTTGISSAASMSARLPAKANSIPDVGRCRGSPVPNSATSPPTRPQRRPPSRPASRSHLAASAYPA